MLRALSEASRILERDEYRAAAIQNAEFLHEQMWLPSKRLLRTWRGGQAKGDAYLDYACLVNGLLNLYEATFWIEGGSLGHASSPRSWSSSSGILGRGGFFDTGRDHETLVLRPKEFFDNAMPSGNSACGRSTAAARGILRRGI